MATSPIGAGPRLLRWNFLVMHFLTEADRAGLNPVAVGIYDIEQYAFHPGKHGLSEKRELIVAVAAKLDRFFYEGILEPHVSLITVDGRVVGIAAIVVNIKKIPRMSRTIDPQAIIDSRPQGFEDWFREGPVA